MEEIDLKCPKGSTKFKKYWNILILDLSKKVNFCRSHLLQLEVLCDMYVQYEDLKNQLKKEGMTYVSEGRNGVQIKPHPALAQFNKVTVEIKNYCMLLGLRPDKIDAPPKEKNEWLD